MNTNTQSRRLGSCWLVVVLVAWVVAALPVVASAATPAAQQVRKHTRKVYYTFVTGSNIPVPYAQIAGGIATTAAHVQVVRINDRNRTQGVEFWSAGHPF